MHLATEGSPLGVPLRPGTSIARLAATIPITMHMRTKGDVTFRDLNKNGKLDPYEDPRCPIEEHRTLPTFEAA